MFLACFSSNLPALLSAKTNGVKLRAGPGTSYKQIMDLPKYYPLKITAKSGKWYKVVDWMNIRGWINSAQVSNQQTVTVRKWRVMLRSGPGIRYRKNASLYQGYILKVLKKYGNWYKVVVVDPPYMNQGWVYRQMVWGQAR